MQDQSTLIQDQGPAAASITRKHLATERDLA